ncbi:hypothetical protein EYB25_002608 [Talaromyces marneffei]|nr:hypothetical protein EYB25_002608 [Talaromyces marneffei]
MRKKRSKPISQKQLKRHNLSNGRGPEFKVVSDRFEVKFSWTNLYGHKVVFEQSLFTQWTHITITSLKKTSRLLCR